MHKKLSLILFIFWSVFLVLFITFGTTLAGKFGKFVTSTVHTSKTKIKEVELTKVDYYLFQDKYIEFNTIPSTSDKNDLIFTPVNEDSFKIDDNFKIYPKNINSDISKEDIVVTSKKYPDFKQTITINLHKTYPKIINHSFFTASRLRTESKDVYLGLPFGILFEFEKELINFSERDIKIEYDPTLFEEVEYQDISTRILKPKYLDYKIGDNFEKITTTIKYIINGKEYTKDTITINPSVKVDEFETIRLENHPSTSLKLNDNTHVYSNKRYHVTLYNDNKPINTYGFKIKSNVGDLVTIQDNYLIFKDTGEVSFSVGLDNGFEKEFKVFVTSQLVEPIINGGTITKDKTIKLFQDEKFNLELEYPYGYYDTWNYSVNNGLINVDRHGNALFLKAYNVGTSILSITLDDGYQEPFVVNYTIEVTPNKNSLNNISKRVMLFNAKVLGHLGLFGILGIIVYYFYYNYKTKNKVLMLILTYTYGLFIGGLTEFIQLFQKGRTSKITDVLIDFTGYMLGILFALMIMFIRKKVKKCQISKEQDK